MAYILFIFKCICKSTRYVMNRNVTMHYEKKNVYMALVGLELFISSKLSD